MKLAQNSRLNIAVITILLFLSNSMASDSGIGNWEGQIFFSQSSKAEVEVSLTRSADEKLSGTIAVPGQSSVPQNLENIKIDGGLVSFDLNDGRTTASFNGLLAEDGSSIKGKFSQAGQLFPFELARGKGGLTSKPTNSSQRQ